jgi:signal transduction histidine kinase
MPGITERGERVLLDLQRLLEAEEAECGRIADELHDDAVQALTACAMHLSLLESRVPGLRGQPAYARARGNLEHGLRAARALLTELRPPTLAARGAAAALGQQLDRLAPRTGCATRLDWRLPGRLASTYEVVLFRAIQQALPRASAPCGVDTVTVTAAPGPGGVTAEVAWTTATHPCAGHQPPPDVPPLAHLHVELLGGTVRTHHTAAGATVAIWLPRPA